jgi:thiol:disulfide interchange protein DsbD
METFKQAMAFFVFGTVIWLIWILSFQVQVNAIIQLLIVFLSVGFTTWVFQRWPNKVWKRLFALAIVVLTLAGLFLRVQTYAIDSTLANRMQLENDLHWEKFSPETLKKYRSEGKPVFLDFTAAWCVSCKVNELLVFQSEQVRKKLKESGVVLMKADWTNQDSVITQTLASFGRSGVPFYVIYGRGKNTPPTPLPEVINASLVLQELEKIK